jgi:hypothetical protein
VTYKFDGRLYRANLAATYRRAANAATRARQSPAGVSFGRLLLFIKAPVDKWIHSRRP